MTDEIQEMTFEQSVRKRPGMYLGSNDSKGIINLLCGIIKDCIFVCKTDKIFFSIGISTDARLSLQINSDIDTSVIVQQFSDDQWSKDIYHLRVLRAVTDKFEVSDNTNGLILNFRLDKSVFKNTTVDYQNLIEELTILALLNRGTEILIKDTTQKHLNQNYFSFPTGMFYLYDRTKGDVLGKPEFEIFYDDQVKENKYQIALAYRTDWFPSPSVTSFANDTHTKCGGTLVDGILDGLISACKKYVADNNLTTHKITRKKFYNGLIIVCSVRGNDFDFDGSFKEALATKEVRKQAKKIIFELVGDYLNSDKDKADKLLWRFDDTQLTSKMY
jgi:DNA gyrase/topoisomerase IV subunit B